MFKKIFLLTAIAFICSSCESPTTITSRGLDSENEKEKAIMQGIALETYYNRVEKLNNIAWPILSSSLDFCKENITCLLYTSPSPRDRTRSRMPSSA